MATIKDVAARAGVSLSTVSHVLNRTRVVLPDTAAKVEAAIRELDYRPNNVARSLKSNRTRTIGMLVANTTNPFFAEVVRGVEAECFRQGYSLILCNTEDEPHRHAAYLDTLYEKRVDALVLMTTNPHGRTFDVDARFSEIPIASLFTSASGANLFVSDDSVLGGQLAGERLAASGCRSFACISGDFEHALVRDRLAGFRSALEQRGLALEAASVVNGDWTLEGGRSAAEALLASGRTFDGIFAMNDMMAIGALSAMRDAGLHVPDDISLIGYDDIRFGEYTAPPLTTISQGGASAGSLAAGKLLELIPKQGQVHASYLLTPTVIERGSVRAVQAAPAVGA